MATSYTSLLGLALPVTGELQGTWGTTVNDSITSLLDTAVAGTTTLSTDGDVTLSTTTGAANQARQAILLCSGARTAQRTITAPAQSKIYTVINATTGGFSVKLVGAGPTTGITIAPGESTLAAWNGSDFIKVSTFGGAGIFTDLTVSGNTTLGDAVGDTTTVSGPMTLSAGTANGVLYLNGSKVATSGSALTFDGNALTLSGATAQVVIPDGRYYLFGSGYSGITGSGVNSSSGYLAFATGAGGSEQMRLTSTGLGIGTSSPSTKLHVYSTGARPVTIGNASATWSFGTTGASFAFRENSSSSDFLTLDSSGNLGLGVTPSAWGSDYRAIDIASGANGGAAVSGFYSTNIARNAYFDGTNWKAKYTADERPALYAQPYAGGHQWFNGNAFVSAGGNISFTQAMTLDASGNLLVNRTGVVGSEKLSVNGGARFETFADLIGGAGTPELRLYQNTNNWSVRNSAGALSFYDLTGSAERARITSGGDLLVGTTSITGGRTVVVGTASSTSVVSLVRSNASGDTAYAAGLFAKYDNDSTTSQVFIRFSMNQDGTTSGQINANGANQAAFGSWSDARLKENIVDLPPQLDNIMALRPVEFDYIESEGGGHQISFIAQEFEQVYPDAVGERADGMKTLSGWDKTTARLVKAIQEQQALITDLRARVAALEAQP